ncbi:MAG TPA: transporter substrate-binding domain-containing protein [Candidatus Aquilonibacter sp.]|nr:transporter substrate-binding domain-containing protein [Candidatus Aquilonibacter sp.]
MRRASLLLVAGVLLASTPRPSTAPDIAAIQKRGTLRVAMLSYDQPPFFERSATGELRGIDVSLARGIAASLGVKVVFDRAAATFDAAAAAVRRGRDDIAVSKMSVSTARAQSLLFTHPYVRMHRALLFNRVAFAKLTKGRTAWDVVHRFDGTLGVVAHSSYAAEARSLFPYAHVVSFARWGDLVDSVRSGATTAAFRDELSVRAAVIDRPDTALRFQTVLLTDTIDEIAAALSWNEPALRDLINTYIDLHGMPYDANTVLARMSKP